jgi:thiol-disulfide isomerase/thioredoxin
MRAITILVIAALTVSACGSDVTNSGEYVSLQARNDALAGELEQAEIDLQAARVDQAVAERELQARDEELADSRSELSGTEATTSAMRSDFADYLSLQFLNAGGFGDTQSDCLGNALLEDADARGAYLLLLGTSNPDRAEVAVAYEGLRGVFDRCDLELPALDDEPADSSPVELPQEVLDATRPVEVIGASLPVLSPGLGPDPAVGKPAPILIGENYAGESTRIDTADAGPTMVIVLAHWCPHCNAEIPVLNQLRDEGLIPDGVHVVAVSSLVNPDAPNFPPDLWLEEMGWTYSVMADGVDLDQSVFVSSDALGVSGVPFTVLIDADGNVADRWAGTREPAEIVAALAELAGG